MYIFSLLIKLLHTHTHNRGHIFLDLPSDLFKHFLHQLGRWSINGNRSANITFNPPSWKVKDEFNEMLIALGFQKYQRSMLTRRTRLLTNLFRIFQSFLFNALNINVLMILPAAKVLVPEDLVTLMRQLVGHVLLIKQARQSSIKFQNLGFVYVVA